MPGSQTNLAARRIEMYHFTFIDEASIETENKLSETQEIELQAAAEEPVKSQNFLKKTAYLLHKYLDQPNCVRIFISKN
jgi:4-diphosphocytidyl-2C-methyl-D-erythritol kinase